MKQYGFANIVITFDIALEANMNLETYHEETIQQTTLFNDFKTM